MKSYYLVLIILISAILQGSFFYSDFGSVGVGIVLCITWFLYLNNLEKEAGLYAIFAGLLVDLIRLSGVGSTSFSILLPLLGYIFLDRLIRFEGTFFAYLTLLIMTVLSGFLGLFISILVFQDVTLEAVGVMPTILSALLNWVVILAVSTVSSIVKGRDASLSIMPSSK